jgi:hypothetical protein
MTTDNHYVSSKTLSDALDIQPSLIGIYLRLRLFQPDAWLHYGTKMVPIFKKKKMKRIMAQITKYRE